MFFKTCFGFCLVLGFGISSGSAQQRPDTTITIFAKENQSGDREFASVGNCLSLYQAEYLRPKVPTVNSISFEPDFNCLRFYEYECCSGRYFDADPAQENQNSARMNKIHTNVSKDSAWFDPRSVGGCLSQSSFLGTVDPPKFLVEPNSTQEQQAKDNTNVKQFDDRNAAVYISYEQEMETTPHWLYNIFSLGWGHVKKNYGDFGYEGKLYGIYHGDNHTDQEAQSRAFIYRDARSNCRNVISVFSSKNSTKAAQRRDEAELDSITAKMAGIVDYIYGGILESPCSDLWTSEQAWADIFRYDLYLTLGMNKDANRIAAQARNKFHVKPTIGSTWFTDWFKPIYDKYNGTQALVNFFKLREQHFPKVVNKAYGPAFEQKMKLGEYIHFTSGAVDTNLWEEGKRAFNLNNYFTRRAWKRQFDDAQRAFPQIKYKDFDKFK